MTRNRDAEKQYKKRAAEDEQIPAELIRAAAHEHKAEAQYRFAKSYEEGTYDVQDDRLAVYWYTKAVLQHHGEAMCRLARYYYTGTYVFEDEALAEALLLVSTDRVTAANLLSEWFDIDIAKDGTYTHHDSIIEAVEHVNEHIKNAYMDVLEMIQDEIIDDIISGEGAIYDEDEWLDDEGVDNDEEDEAEECNEDEECDEDDEDWNEDDEADWYPKPNKYLLPSTNLDLIVGNIKRKLKI